MRQWLLGSLTALATMTSGAAFAAGAPGGSYVLSCTGIGMNGATLVATCRRANGEMVAAQLPGASYVQADIVNCDGVLRAGDCAPAFAPRVLAPRGSYASSCSEVRVEGNTLFATCRRTNGQMQPSQLPDALAVKGDIANCDGFLHVGGCGGFVAPKPIPLPRGSYSHSCDDAHLEGTTLVANCRRTNGQVAQAQLPDATTAQGDIANCDGALRVGGCAGYVAPRPVPPPRCSASSGWT